MPLPPAWQHVKTLLALLEPDYHIDDPERIVADMKAGKDDWR